VSCEPTVGDTFSRAGSIAVAGYSYDSGFVLGGDTDERAGSRAGWAWAAAGYEPGTGVGG